MLTFTTSPGSPLPLGASCTAEGVNFALFSRHAEEVSLLLYESGHWPAVAEITLDPTLHRTGDIWHILIHKLDTCLRYGYRVNGPRSPGRKAHRFSPKNILLDPYAKALTGGSKWGMAYRRTEEKTAKNPYRRRCCIVSDDFDWQGDRPLQIPLKDSIIYELHVRGFTNHASAGVKNPGTYEGLIEKIPYLQELGITAVELMPITEFNENENTNVDPTSGARLKNYWGYNPLSFFAPKAAYAVNGHNGHQVRAFKEMVKALHRGGIEVILDVVFNHTAEGGADGPVFSFRGLDNSIYYLLEPETGAYLNFSGCGNTLNCNHPLVRTLILDALRYWVVEMHVDGFRFDLASILGRDQNGNILANPPMVERIAEDPILANTKIIAEAWDAAGVYQVGSFSSNPRWAEWNGKFRDDIRAFSCGWENCVPTLATRIAGSSDLYKRSGLRPYNGINFVTSHDGFTLADLVSYNAKHNERNGEDNRDGFDNNMSWNSGVEGPASDPVIVAIRARRSRTMAVILFLSQGVPMFAAGDEFGRTQAGNNNAYCQDNEISWLDWRLAEKNSGLLRFFRLLIKLRQSHAVFRRASFFPGPDHASSRAITWHSTTAGRENWSPSCKTLAFFLNGRQGSEPPDNDFYVLLNGHRHTSRTFTLPTPAKGRAWHRLVDTAAPPPQDILPEPETVMFTGTAIDVAPMAALILIAKPT